MIPPLGGDVGVIVVAAGLGLRLGHPRPKALVPLGDIPVVTHALDGVRAAYGDDGLAAHQTVVVGPPGHLDVMRAGLGGIDPVLVAGGADRRDSVAAGLAALPSCDVVVVHDAARCLTPPAVFTRVVDAVRAGADAAVPGLPVVDTVKVVDADGVVRATPARDTLRAVQTPQAFAGPVLRRVHAQTPADAAVTDDAGMVELAGGRVVVVPGDERARKITTPEDLDWALALLEKERTA